MSRNVVHLAGHCKKFNEIVMKFSQHCVGIEPSRNPNTINVFLAGFECYTNSIIFITLLNCRIKYFLTYSFSERLHFTTFVNR